MDDAPLTAGPDAPAMLDARGLKCPLPVVRMEAALRRLAPGARLKVLADDPVALVDIPHFAREGGHGCERARDEEGKPGPGAEEPAFCVFLVTRGEKP